MTFFLQDAGNPGIPARKYAGPTEVPTWGEGMIARTQSAAMRNDANFKALRTKSEVAGEKANAVIDVMGAKEVWETLREQGVVPDAEFNAASMNLLRNNMNWRRPILNLAREDAKTNPDKWSDFELGDDAIEAETNRRLQAEYENLQGIVSMSPGGTGSEFVAEMIGATADVKNLPFAFLGGGSGSFIRAAGRNALINAAAEGVFLPAQFQMAERLEIPDPDIGTQLAIAAGAGGALGFLGEGLERGLRYARARNAPPPGLDGLEAARAEARASVAEDALADGATLDGAVEAVRRSEPRPEVPPLISFPRVPGRSLEPRTRVATAEGMQGVAAERPATATESRQEPQPAPPRPDAADAEEARQDAAQALRDEAEATRTQDDRAKNPFVNFLMRGHRVSKAAREAGETDGPSLQIDPEGTLGGELAAQDITRRRFPQLFKKGGRDRIDNLPADEMEARFPGIIEATGTERGATYLDEQGVLELIKREAGGDSTWLRSRARAAELDRQADEIEVQADRTPQEDFLEGREAEGGFFVDVDQYEFLHGYDARARIEADVDEHLREIGFPVTPAERAELMDEITRTGGDVDFLLERLAIRDEEMSRMPNAEEIYDPIPGFDDETTNAGRSPEGTGDDRRPAGDTGAEGTRTASAEAAGDPVTETTAAGEQQLIPGVEPVTQRQRLEAQQDAPMRGGDAAADEGLFDIGARTQRDMFSDPTSPEARELQDVVATDLRTAVEADGDFDVDVDLPDGTTRRMKASEALDNMDDVDAFSARLDLCGSVPQS